MRIDLALTADAATVDASGKLNILGVFDRIAAASFPVQHGRIALVLRFTGGIESAGRHDVSIRLSGPGGELFHVEGSLQVAPPAPGSRGVLRLPQVFNLDGIVFPSAGHFEIRVSLDGVASVTLPLEIVQAAPSGPVPPPPPRPHQPGPAFPPGGFRA